MSYLEAHLLDRLNVGVVRLRVGGRQPRPDRERLDRYLDRLPADPFEPGLAVELEPRQEVGGRVQKWRSAVGNWVATRICPRQGQRTSGALIFLHGWLATTSHLRLMRLAAAPLLAAGIEVWIPRLPAHVERTPDGAVSGERCLSADLVTTAEAMRRGVSETRALGRWLRGQGRRRVGIWGISLGGWVGALSATVTDRWEAVALWTPVVDPVPTLLGSPLARPIREAMRAGGIETGVVERTFAPFAPVRRDIHIEPAAVRLFAGRYDNVVSPESLEGLAQRWGVACDWFPHGHISILGSRAARRACRGFLSQRLGG